MIPPAVIDALATCCTGIALLVFVIAVLRLGRRPDRALHELIAGIAVALEFLLAGGLLRLSSIQAWMALGSAALIVVVRSSSASAWRPASEP